MFRSIAGVIVGYITLAAVVFVAFSLMYAVLGVDGAYKPGSWEVSTTWVVASLAVGVVAALLGGLVCRLISRRSRGAVVALAVLVAALGAVEIAVQLGKERPTEARPDDVPMFEAAQQSWQPTWVVFANPVIGVVGVLIGGGACRGKAPGADTPA